MFYHEKVHLTRHLFNSYKILMKSVKAIELINNNSQISNLVEATGKGYIRPAQDQLLWRTFREVYVQKSSVGRDDNESQIIWYRGHGFDECPDGI